MPSCSMVEETQTHIWEIEIEAKFSHQTKHKKECAGIYFHVKSLNLEM